MPELQIVRSEPLTAIDQEKASSLLIEFAREWNCELQPMEAGHLLLPEIILRKYGVFVFPIEHGYRVCREEDATTWEDFLLMRLSHQLAAQLHGELYLDGYNEAIQVAPHKFATFDHYVETVLELEDDLVRDMKKYWLYAHRKRSLR